MSTLIFDKYRPPILSVEMMDAERTVINDTPPTVDLQDELRSRMADLQELLNGTDGEQREVLYDLAARLMSCNRNMRKITPDLLRKTYCLDEEDLIVFYQAYAEFLTEIESAKN